MVYQSYIEKYGPSACESNTSMSPFSVGILYSAIANRVTNVKKGINSHKTDPFGMSDQFYLTWFLEITDPSFTTATRRDVAGLVI